MPPPGSSPFTIADLRVLLTNKQDNTNRAPLHSVRSGQKFWVWWAIRANRALTFSTASWTARLQNHGRAIATDSFKFPNGSPTLHLKAGQELTTASDPLAVHGNGVRIDITGKATINGVTQTSSTWVQVIA